MPVCSNDFIEFAKDCEKRNDEIGYRNAIARAYYGAYHHVLPCMTLGPKDNHQGLIDYLVNDAWKGNEPYSKSELVGLGYALQSLKDQRIICDYRLGDTITPTQSRTAIKTAEKLIQRCADMTKSEAS
ncbi:TPA: hypothetical protein MNM99_003592 [Citrobacter freundii]|uniref:hypothetical protein n=1 Tax=Citrobacter TaxID=544 RepID=UPI0023AF62D0|nr:MULTISPECIES: hypothetical protein [Citrobacter]MDM3389411.1 hypothetical protein [Citrobacter sp. Cb013]HCA0685133.1 hypothetical protein [Citrobacter freundii]HCA0719010.1 hypothetical protein [Citrobacter freundii]HCA1542895.1 hypothetical protein [Citrobacter freundii]HCA2005428.1 hypothetical protein [Citrobacter freundii]